MKPKLTLPRETVRNLESADLAAVHGRGSGHSDLLPNTQPNPQGCLACTGPLETVATCDPQVCPI